MAVLCWSLNRIQLQLEVDSASSSISVNLNPALLWAHVYSAQICVQLELTKSKVFG